MNPNDISADPVGTKAENPPPAVEAVEAIEPKPVTAPDIAASPEFQAAVAKGVAAAMAQVKTELMRGAGGNSQAAPVAGTDLNFVRELSMAIAELTDQGTQRKRVAPEILAARAAAYDRMVALITKAHKLGEKPQYRVISKTYLNERMIEPFRMDPQTKAAIAQEIIWNGPPNQCMRPINDVAKEIFDEFVAWIGGSTMVKGTDNRPMHMTANGLVVIGLGAGQRREVSQPTEVLADPYENMLTVHAPQDPSAPLINVLGTVAAPAQQNVASGVVAHRTAA